MTTSTTRDLDDWVDDPTPDVLEVWVVNEDGRVKIGNGTQATSVEVPAPFTIQINISTGAPGSRGPEGPQGPAGDSGLSSVDVIDGGP